MLQSVSRERYLLASLRILQRRIQNRLSEDGSAHARAIHFSAQLRGSGRGLGSCHPRSTPYIIQSCWLRPLVQRCRPECSPRKAQIRSCALRTHRPQSYPNWLTVSLRRIPKVQRRPDSRVGAVPPGNAAVSGSLPIRIVRADRITNYQWQLKTVLQVELDLPWWRADAADLAEVAVRYSVVRVSIAGNIKDVEDIRAER